MKKQCEKTNWTIPRPPDKSLSIYEQGSMTNTNSSETEERLHFFARLNQLVHESLRDQNIIWRNAGLEDM
jgi:hypothetical protein